LDVEPGWPPFLPQGITEGASERDRDRGAEQFVRAHPTDGVGVTG
jgi:hypothetical protein